MAVTAFYFVTERGRLKLLCASSKTCSHFHTMCWCNPEVALADTRLYRCWYVYNMHMKYVISATKINILLFATILLLSSLNAETMRVRSLPGRAARPLQFTPGSAVLHSTDITGVTDASQGDWRLSATITPAVWRASTSGGITVWTPRPPQLSLGHRYQKTCQFSMPHE